MVDEIEVLLGEAVSKRLRYVELEETDLLANTLKVLKLAVAQVVNNVDLVALFHQPFHKVAAYEPSATSY
jgi:hypothetical protein